VTTEERLAAIEGKLDRIVRLVDELQPYLEAARTATGRTLLRALTRGGKP